MSYAQAFADALAAKGLSIDVNVIPEQNAVDSDLAALGDWLGSLEENTHEAIDLVTAENPIQAGLADPSVGIVQNIGKLLAVFDQQQASTSISTALQILKDAASAASTSTPGDA